MLYRNIEAFPKGTTFDITNLQPGEIIHMDYFLYHINSIRGFTYIINVFCANTIMLRLFPTVSKRSPDRIIRFILTTLNKKQHPCKRVRVDEYGALENSIGVTNLIVDDLNISMEAIGGDASWINGNN